MNAHPPCVTGMSGPECVVAPVSPWQPEPVMWRRAAGLACIDLQPRDLLDADVRYEVAAADPLVDVGLLRIDVL